MKGAIQFGEEMMTKSPPPKKRFERIQFIDSLRGVAALLVLIPHSAGIMVSAETPYFVEKIWVMAGNIGHRGVEIFFVISGFVIACSVQGKRVSLGFFGNFVLRRFIRLDPPYWAAMVMMIVILMIKNRFGSIHHDLPSLDQIIAHLFYLQAFLGYEQIIVIFWTLCLEIQFYLIYCFILYLLYKLVPAERKNSIEGCLFIFCFFLSVGFAENFGFSGIPGLFIGHWYKFLIGVLVWKSHIGEIRKAIVISLIFLLIFIGLWFLHFPMLSTGVAALVIISASHFGKLHVWLSHKIFRFYGKISYSLYLIHVPIALLLLGLIVRLPQRNMWINIFGESMFIFTSTVAAWILYLVIEKPCVNLSGKFKKKYDF